MTNIELDKISAWMGKPCTCTTTYGMMGGEDVIRYWGSCLAHSNGGESIPWGKICQCRRGGNPGWFPKYMFKRPQFRRRE